MPKTPLIAAIIPLPNSIKAFVTKPIPFLIPFTKPESMYCGTLSVSFNPSVHSFIALDIADSLDLIFSIPFAIVSLLAIQSFIAFTTMTI